MSLQNLYREVQRYKEPESVRILEEKVEKEKEYLQRTIIQMELKQMAESLALIAYRKVVKFNGIFDEKAVKNSPQFLKERLENMKYEQKRKKNLD